MEHIVSLNNSFVSIFWLYKDTPCFWRKPFILLAWKGWYFNWFKTSSNSSPIYCTLSKVIRPCSASLDCSCDMLRSGVIDVTWRSSQFKRQECHKPQVVFLTRCLLPAASATLNRHLWHCFRCSWNFLDRLTRSTEPHNALYIHTFERVALCCRWLRFRWKLEWHFYHCFPG